MIDATKLRRIAEVMQMVADDCETEALGVDQTPFTPLGVGSRLGNMLAEIRAVAIGVGEIAGMLAEKPSQDEPSLHAGDFI